MDTNNTFNWAGDKVGQAIRAVVEGLAWLFGHFYAAIDSFVSGLTSALGIDASIFSLGILAIGLAMLVAAGRALFGRSFVAALIWALLGLILLSWLIH